jgi:hypothetical protein
MSLRVTLHITAFTLQLALQAQNLYKVSTLSKQSVNTLHVDWRQIPANYKTDSLTPDSHQTPPQAPP